MALVNFSNLDFEDIKSSLKEYLRANSDFTDYDFEGSNLSQIIDVLAYNTYVSSYNANMVSNEVFIDSATLRENVVSLARNIGYTPRSRKSAQAKITFLLDTTLLSSKPTSITLQKGVVATTSGNFDGESYTFSINDPISVPVVEGVATFDAISIFEGTYVTQTFTVDANNPNQKFILPNANIDTSSIRVSVKNTETSTVRRKFSLANNLIGISPTSKVFFIQEIEDQRYELIFGDDVFGKKLDNSNFIEISYLVSSGKAANGVSNFKYAGRCFDQNGTLITDGISQVATDIASNNGQELESVDSVKKYAPRIYASQNRAVTSGDYESIIPTIYPEAESISVYGGETLTPPRFGKVFVSIKPFNGQFISRVIKDNIIAKLKQYTVAGIVPEIIDLKYLYVEYNVTAYYNSNLSPGAATVKSIIDSSLSSYSDSADLNKFGARFKYSKFQKVVDDSHDSVVSNITTITMRRDAMAAINALADYELCFGNGFHIKRMSGYNIKTSGFNVDGIVDTVYLSDLPSSATQGSLYLFKLKSPTEPLIVRKNVGTIDYEKGEVRLKPIKITRTEKTNGGIPVIQVSACPKSNDVIGKEDLYLQLDINNSVVRMQLDEISSGANTAGSTYISTSSYSNGDLVRS